MNRLGCCLIESLVGVLCKVDDNGRAGCHGAHDLNIKHNLAIAVGVLPVTNRNILRDTNGADSRSMSEARGGEIGLQILLSVVPAQFDERHRLSRAVASW